jgi:hypothetical protein
MITRRDKILPIGAWSLAAAVCTLAIIAWGRDAGWHVLPFNSYLWFPLLGLLAFSLMWTHYLTAAARDLTHTDPAVLRPYYRYTGYVVLALICLHPGLLIYQRYVDGAGLPPGSYESYVAPGLGWITILGTASLLVFLAFELHRWLGQKPWWHYVRNASDLAMLAIVYHSLRLGQNLTGGGWFRYVWWFYAAALLAVLIRKYSLKLMPKPGR